MVICFVGSRLRVPELKELWRSLIHNWNVTLSNIVPGTLDLCCEAQLEYYPWWGAIFFVSVHSTQTEACISCSLPIQHSPAASMEESIMVSHNPSPAWPLCPLIPEGSSWLWLNPTLPLCFLVSGTQQTLAKYLVSKWSNLSVCSMFAWTLREWERKAARRQAVKQEGRKKERKRKLYPMAYLIEHHFCDNEKWLEEKILERVNNL